MRLRKRFSRRAVQTASILLLLTAAFLLAGCGRESADDLLFEPATITYVAPDFPLLSVPEQAAIELFHERAPGIEVDRQALVQDVESYLLDESPPDAMLLWVGYTLRRAAQSNLLSDLSDIWSENNFADAYGERFREMSRFEGTLRFIPAGFSWAGVYYNKEIFERYGLAPPATWEEFMRICDTLIVNGETPLSLAGQNPFISYYWFDYLNLRLNGPDFHRRLIEGKVSYEDERVALVWETWMSLLQGAYFVESSGQTSEIGSLNALVRGDADSPLTREKAVMALVPHFSLNQLPPLFSAELDFFQFPQLNPNHPVGEISVVFGYAIPAGAAHRPQAGVFAGYMGSAEAQAAQLGRIREAPANAGYVPVHREVERALAPAAAQKGEKIVRDADAVSPPLFLAQPPRITARFDQVLRKLFLTRDISIQAPEIQAILEEARQETIRNGEYAQ